MAATIQTIQKPTRARALDTSGNNNHGQIYSGRALEFDGATDYLDTGLKFSETNHTIAFWAKMNAHAANGNIFDSRDSDDDGILIKVTSDEKFKYHLNDSDLESTHAYENTWVRVVCTYDGTTQNLYINGFLDDTDDVSKTVAVTGFDIIIGKQFTGSSVYYDGLLSDLQAWNTAWTAEDVLYDYNNPEQLALNRGGTSLTNSNLKIWYPMNDGHRGQQSYILDASNTGISDNLLTNPNFDSDISGWNTSNFDTFEWDSSNKRLHVKEEGAHWASVGQNITLSVGASYYYSFDGVKVGSTDLLVQEGSNTTIRNVTASGTYSGYFNATQASGFYFKVGAADGNFEWYLDNVVLKVINDKNHATTEFYGDEILATKNQGFESAITAADADDGWMGEDEEGTLNARIVRNSGDGQTGSYSGKITQAANAATRVLLREDSFVIGRTYRVQGSAKKPSSGGSTTITFGVGTGMNTTTSSNGSTLILGTSYAIIPAFDFVATATTHYIHFIVGGLNTNICYIDDLSVKEVGTASGWTDADQQLHIPQTALQSYNQLAWFDGTQGADNYIAFSDGSSDLNFQATDRTISFWFYPLEEDDENGYVMSKGTFGTGGDGSGWYIYYNSSTGVLQYYTNQTGANQPNNAPALTYGEWAHCAVVISDSGTDSTWYINGEADTPKTNHVAPASDTQNYNLMNRAGATKACGGSINEVSIWNKSFGPTEITELYNDGKALNARNHSSGTLLHYWRNNGLSTWTDIGKAGSLYNGTPTNITETMLITAGVDGSRDSQGFLMNRQRTTNSLNLLKQYGDNDSSSYAFIRNNPLYTGAVVPEWSFSLWVKFNRLPSDTAETAALIDGYIGNSTASIMVIIDADNVLSGRFYTDASGTYRHQTHDLDNDVGGVGYDASEEWKVDTWIHLAGAFKKLASDTTIFLYANGKQIAGSATAYTDAWQMHAANSSPIAIGGNLDSTTPTISDTMKGDCIIDDVCLYSKYLDADEIKRNYNAGKRSHR